MKRRGDRWIIPVSLLAVLMGMLACAVGPLPSAGVTPTPCASTCPPPQRDASTSHVVSLADVRVTYFDPWSVSSSSSTNVVLVAQTNLGQVSAEISTQTVTAGTTAGQLVSRAARQLLDPNDYSGVADDGPILGAEVGYVPGAGEDYSATTTDPNAPSTPVYLEVMASVRGNVAVIFAALSPLDPSTANPSGAPDQAYDALVNSVRWT